MPKTMHEATTTGAGEPRATRGLVAIRGLLAGAAMFLAGGAAMAQAPAQPPAAEPTPAPCTNMDKLGATQLRVTQQFGRALVELSRPNSTGRKVEIEYGDESYVG